MTVRDRRAAAVRRCCPLLRERVALAAGTAVVCALRGARVADARRRIRTESAAEDVAWDHIPDDGSLGNKRVVDEGIYGAREESVVACILHARLEVCDGPRFWDGHVDDLCFEGQHRDRDLVHHAVARHARRTFDVVRLRERAFMHDRRWHPEVIPYDIGVVLDVLPACVIDQCCLR